MTIWGRKLPRIWKDTKVEKTKNYYLFWSSLGITFIVSLIVMILTILWSTPAEDKLVLGTEQEHSSPTTGENKGK